MNWRKYAYERWNIGFCNLSPSDLLKNKSLGKIQWMKHSYRDRFFADPFVYKTTNDIIIIWAEEVKYEDGKGVLVELEVHKLTKKLLKRRLLLELDTHLSYPIYYRLGNKTVVCPENSQSKRHLMYEYKESTHSLHLLKILVPEPLTDATIVEHNSKYYLFTTKASQSHENCFLYEAARIEGPYLEYGIIQSSKVCSRPAGRPFMNTGIMYRIAQNCSKRYGYGIEIMKIEEFSPYREESIVSLKPTSWKYHLGLHTLNFHEDVCVIDGYGYYSPMVGRLIQTYSSLKQSVRSLFHCNE